MTTTTTLQGMNVERNYTVGMEDVYESVSWTKRDALIQAADGTTVFFQSDVEAPAFWSQTAVNIVASKYFHGAIGTPERESSVRQLIERVVATIQSAGIRAGYFRDKESAVNFERELIYLLINQAVSFNSPVWFNVGCDMLEPDNSAENWHWDAASAAVIQEATGYKHPQCSACFINSVKDSMSSILDLAKTEGMLFKWGSGSGTNLSVIRGSRELLSGGGTASGPLSFMRGYDAFAGVIKSGGKTRRAAKMVILDADHPDIEDFIECKGTEEQKAYALIREGYDGNGPDSEAYSSIFFQNANNSVRASDDFMQAVVDNGDWNLVARKGGATTKTLKAADLLRKIAEQTHQCGDPGMQFDTTINNWHTCKASGRINASNPCSEYMFLDDSACNLASFNLTKFLNKAGIFDSAGFAASVRLLIIAMDILVDMAGYPTQRIAQNSHDYRPLGLGYANLGNLLMLHGFGYDSEPGRQYAAAITALMGGAAYEASAELASVMPVLPGAGGYYFAPNDYGAFPAFTSNAESFLNVIAQHRKQLEILAENSPITQVLSDAMFAWEEAEKNGRRYGFRNAQVTVLAPTGTIGFKMDAQTTGIEPMLGLVTWKKMVGGGYMSVVNQSVSIALAALGYTTEQIKEMEAHIDLNGTIEGSPVLRDDHLSIFDCALAPAKGTRSISWLGHLKMMAAVQPFLSGAISKTVNMPNSATVDEIAEAYVTAWRLGLKSVAIYRDGSKAAQPLSVTKDKVADVALVTTTAAPGVDLDAPPQARRHRLPDERQALTHKFAFGGHEGYLSVGLYKSGQVGEIFIRMAKEGSTISGLMDTFATMVSVALQHGVPLQVVCDKLAYTSFEPSGWTGNPQIGHAKSIMDYIGRWLKYRFLDPQQLNIFNTEHPSLQDVSGATSEFSEASVGASEAPFCKVCGSQTQKVGACHCCGVCGTTTGCS